MGIVSVSYAFTTKDGREPIHNIKLFIDGEATEDSVKERFQRHIPKYVQENLVWIEAEALKDDGGSSILKKLRKRLKMRGCC
jgi:hypothetical protein